MKAKILILEDEVRMRRLLELVLLEPGYEVRTAADGRQGVVIWQKWHPDIVLSDLKMPVMDGIEVLRFRNSYFPATPFILLTAFGTVETAVAAMKEGAFDYLTKPVDNNKVLELVAMALSAAGLQKGNKGEMIGSSTLMRQLRREISMVAATDSSVLITGESGTGKELVAGAICQARGGVNSPFIRVNCPAIPKELLESELFGHRRGAFTGALENRRGAFLAADGGILFLDEIGDLPLSLQPKLLHAVEQKQVTPVGGTTSRTVRVKIITATNLDLNSMISEGKFRQDLFYRLNTLQLHLPPLRDRKEDIEELADCFLHEFCTQYRKEGVKMAAAVLDIMRDYSWPGNIRELRNIIERGCLKCRGDIFDVELLPEIMTMVERSPEQCVSSEKNFDLVGRERELIVRALKKCGWNQSRAALRLGITRNTLRYRMKKYGVKKDPG
jgi:DNA-binding NtrC family response regulator